MRPGPSDINCLQGIYADGGAGMGIKPRVGGEGGGYVVNVQFRGRRRRSAGWGRHLCCWVPGSSTKLNRHLGPQKL